jgi:serine/threonine-protein kinase HipA
MSELALDVRLDGFVEPIGTLSRTNEDGLVFQYQSQYSKLDTALPLSLSLPLTDEPYGDLLTRAFFDNLLQERDGPLQSLMAREGIARDDVAGLLFHLGKDCSGAISVLPMGAVATKVPGNYNEDYDIVSEEKIAEIVKSLHERNIFPVGTEDPSPLAGVQNKFAMTLLPDGRYGWPKIGSGAPTTHIVKVPKRSHIMDAKLEDTTLRLSKALGQETARAETRILGGIQFLLVWRFDRALNNEGLVTRIHQEDFAQALGLPRELKYERRGTMQRRFDAQAINRVLSETSEPAISKARFIGATVFDIITGNADAHAKNHALIYDRSKRPRLAPRYDLIPTTLDPSYTDEMAFRIGAAEHANDMTALDFDEFLKVMGVSTAGGRKRIAIERFSATAYQLAPLLEEIANHGMKNYADLIASNMRKVLPQFGLPVPEPAQNRDAFIQRGGGWLLS